MTERACSLVDSVYLIRYPDDIITDFKSKKESAGCRVSYMNMQFKIECPKAIKDQALSQFLKIYTAYIEQEKSKVSEDNFELPRLQRRSETIIRDDPSAIYRDAAKHENDVKENLDDANNLSTRLIPHESIVRVYNGPEEGLSLEIYKKLEKLTNCAIVIDEATDKIRVKGDTAEDVEIVFAKMQTISSTYLRRTSRTFFSNFYIPENEVNFKFHLSSPKKVIDRHVLFEVPNFLHDFLELSMVKWNYTSQQFVPVRSRGNVIHYTEDSCHPWSAYVYPSLGSESQDRPLDETGSIRLHGHLAPAQINTLHAWTENVPLETVNPFDAESIEKAAGFQTVPAKDVSQKEYVKAKRVVKGQAKAPTNATDVGTSSIIQPPPIEPPFMPATKHVSEDSDVYPATASHSPKPTAPIPTTYRDRGDLFDHPEPLDFVPTEIRHGKKAVQKWVIRQANIDVDQQEQEQLRQLNLTLQPLQPVVKTVQTEQKISKPDQQDEEDQLEREQHQQLSFTPQALQPVLETVESQEELITFDQQDGDHQQEQDQPSQLDPAQQPMQAGLEMIQCEQEISTVNQQGEEEELLLLDFTQQSLQPVPETVQSKHEISILDQEEEGDQQEQERLRQFNRTQQPLQPVLETVQTEQEINTRSYRRDRQLRAPRRTTSSIIEATPVAERVTAAISDILDLARTAYGRVTLQVAFGHFFIPRTEDAKSRTVDQSDWKSIFKGAGSVSSNRTVFLSTLTTAWVDANFIADLELPSGTRMFDKLPADARVTYIIKCANTYTKEDFTVEVDQDGEHKFYNKSQSIGSVNCHFPKRIWDARFDVTETAIADLNPQDPLRSVVDILWVRKGPLVNIGGRTSDPEIKVTGILVHRQTSYPSSANPDLQLRLTEVQDLVLLRCPESQFQAYAAPEEQMIHDGNRTWWEASILSTVADAVLKENRTLELGEVAEWTNEDIVGMCIISDMFHLAQQVVTRIDSVGLDSNPVLVREQHSATKSVAKTTAKTAHSAKYGARWSAW